MPITCESGGFWGCKNEPIGWCVYCGKKYCEKHGKTTEAWVYWTGSLKEVSVKSSEPLKVCQFHQHVPNQEYKIYIKFQQRLQKLDAENENRLHFAEKQNGKGFCGYPSCRNAPKYECRDCKKSYCHLHIASEYDSICPGCGDYCQEGICLSRVGIEGRPPAQTDVLAVV